jgi:hypothetical protein
MIRVRHSILIHRPVCEVFDFVVNAENDCRWVALAREIRKLTRGPVGVGTQFRQTGELLGCEVLSIWQIVELEQYRRVRAEGLSGSADITGQYDFECVRGGTLVSKEGTIEFRGPLRMAEPVLAIIVQYSLEGDLARLKSLLEQKRRRSGKGRKSK